MITIASNELKGGCTWKHLLHRFFLEENGKDFNQWMDEDLPINCKDMRLGLALEIIGEACKESGKVKKGETLTVFVGVDEYQVLNTLNTQARHQNGQDFLRDLLNAFVDIMCNHMTHVQIFFTFYFYFVFLFIFIFQQSRLLFFL